MKSLLKKSSEIYPPQSETKRKPSSSNDNQKRIKLNDGDGKVTVGCSIAGDNSDESNEKKTKSFIEQINDFKKVYDKIVDNILNKIDEDEKKSKRKKL
jgi:hypothetical protein